MARSSKRWWILASSMLAQTFTSMLQFGLPFLLPQLQQYSGSPAGGALLVAAPSVGLIVSLLAWGWLADRFGERITMILGLSAGAVALAVPCVRFSIASPPTPVGLWCWLFFTSALLAAVNSASGRLIVAWFPFSERGLAMGIRQTSQPLGVALAAALFPGVVIAAGLQAAFMIVLGGCLVATVLILVAIPSRAPSSPAVGVRLLQFPGSPYVRPELWRVHGASALLTISQFVFSVFGFTYLVINLEWEPILAGLFFTGANILSALMRVLLGWVSDYLGSRLQLLRWLAYALAGIVGALAALDFVTQRSGASTPIIIGPLLVALFLSCVLSSSNNGLSYALVAEIAGSRWMGRALGAQNTVQNAVAMTVPPLGAIAIGLVGFGGVFAVGAVAAGLAAVSFPGKRSDARRMAVLKATPGSMFSLPRE